LHVFDRHLEPVYSLSFAPSRPFLLFGSMDKKISVYSAKNGSLIKTLTADGAVFNVAWNSTGDRFAAVGNYPKVSIDMINH
jgi:WD40 repeat protein